MARHLCSLIFLLVLGIVGVTFCAGETSSREKIRADDQKSWDEALEDLKHKFCMRSIRTAKVETDSWPHASRHDFFNADKKLTELHHQAYNDRKIDFSAMLTTYAGHIVFCNKRIAEKVVAITEAVAHTWATEEIVHDIPMSRPKSG